MYSLHEVLLLETLRHTQYPTHGLQQILTSIECKHPLHSLWAVESTHLDDVPWSIFRCLGNWGFIFGVKLGCFLSDYPWRHGRADSESDKNQWHDLLLEGMRWHLCGCSRASLNKEDRFLMSPNWVPYFFIFPFFPSSAFACSLPAPISTFSISAFLSSSFHTSCFPLDLCLVLLTPVTELKSATSRRLTVSTALLLPCIRPENPVGRCPGALQEMWP